MRQTALCGLRQFEQHFGPAFLTGQRGKAGDLGNGEADAVKVSPMWHSGDRPGVARGEQHRAIPAPRQTKPCARQSQSSSTPITP